VLAHQLLIVVRTVLAATVGVMDTAEAVWKLVWFLATEELPLDFVEVSVF